MATVRGDEGVCLACSKPSSRVHSRYRRTLTDAPVAGRLIRIFLRVRRFFCDSPECRRKTFVEQVDRLTRRSSRVCEGLRRMLTAIGLALAGRAGARLSTLTPTPRPPRRRPGRGGTSKRVRHRSTRKCQWVRQVSVSVDTLEKRLSCGRVDLGYDRRVLAVSRPAWPRQ